MGYVVVVLAVMDVVDRTRRFQLERLRSKSRRAEYEVVVLFDVVSKALKTGMSLHLARNDVVNVQLTVHVPTLPRTTQLSFAVASRQRRMKSCRMMMNHFCFLMVTKF